MFTSPTAVRGYQCIERMALGQYTETFLAVDLRQSSLPKRILKCLNRHRLAQLGEQLFQHEVRVLSDLQSVPEVPQLLEYLNEEACQVMVQEYVAGVTLQQRLSHEPRWSETKLLNFLRGALLTLQKIHNLGIVHRDLKPEHWVYQPAAQLPSLIDFGAADYLREWDHSVLPSSVAVGTAGYAAPEQLNGLTTCSSDLYALGMISLQGLTGQHPVRLARTTLDAFLREPGITLSEGAIALLRRLTHTRWQDRYQTTTEVLADLEGYQPSALSEQPSLARQPAIPMTSKPTERTLCLLNKPERWGAAQQFLNELRVKGWQISDSAIAQPIAYLLLLEPPFPDPLVLQPLAPGEPPIVPIRLGRGIPQPLPNSVRITLQGVRQYLWRSPADTDAIDAVLRASNSIPKTYALT